LSLPSFADPEVPATTAAPAAGIPDQFVTYAKFKLGSDRQCSICGKIHGDFGGDVNDFCAYAGVFKIDCTPEDYLELGYFVEGKDFESSNFTMKNITDMIHPQIYDEKPDGVESRPMTKADVIGGMTDPYCSEIARECSEYLYGFRTDVSCTDAESCSCLKKLNCDLVAVLKSGGENEICNALGSVDSRCSEEDFDVLFHGTCMVDPLDGACPAGSEVTKANFLAAHWGDGCPNIYPFVRTPRRRGSWRRLTSNGPGPSSRFRILRRIVPDLWRKFLHP
jgi:hypothetical protein